MGGLGDLVETFRPRRTGSVANVHVERLAAAWANEPAPWLVEEPIPRRLVEFDHVDRVGNATSQRFTIEAKVPGLASIGAAAWRDRMACECSAIVMPRRPRLPM
jgi:hypothetical protein